MGSLVFFVIFKGFAIFQHGELAKSCLQHPACIFTYAYGDGAIFLLPLRSSGYVCDIIYVSKMYGSRVPLNFTRGHKQHDESRIAEACSIADSSCVLRGVAETLDHR